MSDPNYKYNEGSLIKEVKTYIDSTYTQHYAGGPVQPGELMMAIGIGGAYFTGNIIKYAARYGKKNGYNRKDLLKIIHYAIMAMADADRTEQPKPDETDERP